MQRPAILAILAAATGIAALDYLDGLTASAIWLAALAVMVCALARLIAGPANLDVDAWAERDHG